MKRSRSTASIIANPVLVGSVTVLVTVVAVFLAYNANNGLPFVPTYDLRVQLPSGAKLVKGNDVRIGGFRVGAVDDIQPAVVDTPTGRHAIAVVRLRLEKKVQPLSADSQVTVRGRSALGLKYVEVIPGHGRRTLSPGATIPLRNSNELADFEDVLATFDRPTRVNVQATLRGAGDGFASRGASLNAAIAALNPFLLHLTPVMSTLADPRTQLAQFVRQLARLTEQLAPVAAINARLFGEMADTFAALGQDPAALQATIEGAARTEAVGTAALRVQRPFYADFADLSRRLRPAAAVLPAALPPVNRALAAGTSALPRTPPFNAVVANALSALDRLFQRPSTLMSLRNLYSALAVTRPALEFIAPYETVCNDTSYFINELSLDFAAPATGGTAQNQGAKLANATQPNSLGTSIGSRPADVPANQDPQTAKNAGGSLNKLNNTLGAPAIDAQGNANCAIGQLGYPFRLVPPGSRYRPSNDPNLGGGSHTVLPPFSRLPILLGGTYKSRQLGIRRLQDVP